MTFFSLNYKIENAHTQYIYAHILLKITQSISLIGINDEYFVYRTRIDCTW